MELKFVCTYWGKEELGAEAFLEKVLEEGYDGIEINIPPSEKFANDLLEGIDRIRNEKRDFIFIAQQVLPAANETVDAYFERFTARLQYLASLKPDFINSHTGKDYFSFDDNCHMIETAAEISAKTGINIIHETHRGRFSFHTASILPYLDKYPDILLAADFSHWCTVSESLLQDQLETLKIITPHVAHIHARVGYENGPQVNDPQAPEWKNHLETFIQFWNDILNYHEKKGTAQFSILPEAGPIPYMPTAPFTNKPLGDQWQINASMKNLLKSSFLL